MTPKNLRNDRDAQVGIGTMIVFIATILVAAVAAGVLIDTSQKLQDKSTRTGNEAVNSVGTSLDVLNVWGDRGGTGSTDKVDDIYVDVQLSAGATAVDLTDLVIHYNDGAKLVQYSAPTLANFGTEADGTFYVKTVLRDDDNSFVDDVDAPTAYTGVLNAGDIVRVAIGQYNNGASVDLELDESTDVEVDMALAAGSPANVGFTTPTTYGQTQIWELF